MDERSSTSSSEAQLPAPEAGNTAPVVPAGRASPHPPPQPPRGSVEHQKGFPWALLIALLIVAGVEVFLHVGVPWTKAVMYDVGLDEYQAVKQRLTVSPPSQVIFVGSSRTRESVVIPEIRKQLERAM